MAKPREKQDPNKYLKNKDIKAESKRSVLLAVVRMGLVLAGIAGLAMEFFKDGGLIVKAMSWLFDSGEHMLFIPVIIFVLWLANRMISAEGHGDIKKSGELPMYIMMALGAYYILKFFEFIP
ncbi:MAG TPA: hypothetical protein PL131_05125 [Methylotenera sp.]|nr:hypothetical protein [Methylotenera sp.]HPH05236.1 hypothetical protein [Methylotenera sp.]HPN00138.1 hypothetical protein [Methylotenera sp.]